MDKRIYCKWWTPGKIEVTFQFSTDDEVRDMLLDIAVAALDIPYYTEAGDWTDEVWELSKGISAKRREYTKNIGDEIEYHEWDPKEIEGVYIQEKWNTLHTWIIATQRLATTTALMEALRTWRNTSYDVSLYDRICNNR